MYINNLCNTIRCVALTQRNIFNIFHVKVYALKRTIKLIVADENTE